MTVQEQYADTARRATDAWTNTAEAWSQNISKVTDAVRTPVIPFVATDATAVVEQWFDFTERVVQVNRDYLLNLAGVANAFGGAVRQHVEGLGGAVRDQVQAVSHTAKDQAEKVGEAQRESARQSRRAARERYEGRTKAELAEELGNRELPKTGNVEDLIERLVDADLQ